ncbi:MAG: UDP-N-acetylmuramoyl-L-alanine--D-glutamate ligase, partial [Crocinitomicaceae bacterium]
MQGKGKHIAILGAGESGLGAAILAIKQEWNVFVSDAGKIKEEFRLDLQNLNVEWEEGQHDETR